MSTILIICATLIIIVAIICYANYKCKCNDLLFSINRQIELYMSEIHDNTTNFEQYWKELMSLRLEIQNLIDSNESK